MKQLFLIIFCLIAAGCANSTESSPRKISGVPYPENYRADFIHYATIDRVDGTIRDLYINPNTVFNGRNLPENTVIVVEAYYAKRDGNGNLLTDENGHFIKDTPFEMIHVIEKRGDWKAADFVSSARIGDWNFGTFEVESGTSFDESLNDCFNCHNPTQHTDFIYSLPLLAGFSRTQEVQYFYCDLPDRLAC